ncbi:phosphoglycerate mutase [Methylocaldum marinum]|uniref:Phosphoglycerate mutase n=1 Tax=Methylocaldum marinum TaxID=1432792 RepID=A0A250KMC5_9GAMM|nr:2,3-bisphosphoglycerate-independent phosphoglycerate mutase [Methylocaldum marinum]BBA32704.1 phosphoglycerate mutase [Methylocaldum marinum]
MDSTELIPRLTRKGESKIVFLIADGLGGIPGNRTGTELETAATPHLDRLARDGVTGLLAPVGPGITCGSGPGHLALFGYDPLETRIGRGVLTALGVNFDLGTDDIAARGNFCTVDEHGVVRDRRAGRISSERGAELSRKLRNIEIEGVELFVEPVKEHRFLLVLRGAGLDPALSDTDPHEIGMPPQPPRGRDESSRRTARLIAAFVEGARKALANERPANMVLLRGFDRLPRLPSMGERYGLNACALAGYPMYQGIARLLGMRVVECGPDLDSEVETLQSAWKEHDFFFVHYKATDSAGEDGDFDAKVRAIEELDRHLPPILALKPDVLVVTGDHSTPSQLKGHSWHPVPVVLTAASCRRDVVASFGETACAHGGLGQLPMKYLMSLALAHAGRLSKFGA